MTADKKIPVVYIVGPTASGKTELSVRLAQKFNGAVICGDSMQIYKNMSIATAAPTNIEKGLIEHRMFEFLNPDTSFSVSDYVSLAKKEISNITNNNKLPFVVGGTGLYIDSLANNIDFGEEFNDGYFRNKSQLVLNAVGSKNLYDLLCKTDYEYALKISPNDSKRIIRALEIYYLTGQTMSYRNELSLKNGLIYNNLFIGVTYKDREKLYERINRRVEIMFENGLLNEAKISFEKYNNNSTAMQAIGHKELFPFFKGEKTLDEVKENLKTQTRHYAKRQLTWFNKNNEINWIFADESENIFTDACNIIENWLNQQKGKV